MKQIPLEVKARIAAQLDLPSARNLTVSCKAWRNAGEMAVWNEVDLTTGWYDKPACTEDFIDETEHDIRNGKVDTKLERIRDSLKAYPFRWKCIQSIRIEPSDGGEDDGMCSAPQAKALISFITRVAPRLTRISILPLPLAEDLLDEQSCEMFTSMLGSLKLNFPKVTHVQFARGFASEAAIPTWILRIKTLQHLEVARPDVSFVADLGHISPTILSGMFPHLTTVTVHRIGKNHDQHAREIITALLEVAPKLATVRITGLWERIERDSRGYLPEVWRQTKRSRTISIIRPDKLGNGGSAFVHETRESTPSSTPVYRDSDDEDSDDASESYGYGGSEGGYGDGFGGGTGRRLYSDSCASDDSERLAWKDSNLPTEDLLTEKEVFAGGIKVKFLEEAVITMDLAKGCEEFPCDTIIVENDKTVSRLTVVTTPRLTGATKHTSQSPDHTAAILGPLLTTLRRVPELSVIYIPSAPGLFSSDFVSPARDAGRFVHPNFWTDGQRGAIIRHYVSGNDVLWHIRIRDGCSAADSGGAVKPDDDCRTDLACYKDRVLPRSVLQAVYEKAALDIDSTEGGRRLSLGDGSAWDILRNWAEKTEEM